MVASSCPLPSRARSFSRATFSTQTRLGGSRRPPLLSLPWPGAWSCPLPGRAWSCLQGQKPGLQFLASWRLPVARRGGRGGLETSVPCSVAHEHCENQEKAERAGQRECRHLLRFTCRRRPTCSQMSCPSSGQVLGKPSLSGPVAQLAGTYPRRVAAKRRPAASIHKRT